MKIKILACILFMSQYINGYSQDTMVTRYDVNVYETNNFKKLQIKPNTPLIKLPKYNKSFISSYNNFIIINDTVSYIFVDGENKLLPIKMYRQLRQLIVRDSLNQIINDSLKRMEYEQHRLEKIVEIKRNKIDSTNNANNLKNILGANYKKVIKGEPWLNMNIDIFKNYFDYFKYYYNVNKSVSLAHQLHMIDSSTYDEKYVEKYKINYFYWTKQKTTSTVIEEFKNKEGKGLIFTNGILTKIIE